MSYENRKKEYERVKALGKPMPENLAKEFGDVKKNGTISNRVSINKGNNRPKVNKRNKRPNNSKR